MPLAKQQNNSLETAFIYIHNVDKVDQKMIWVMEGGCQNTITD